MARLDKFIGIMSAHAIFYAMLHARSGYSLCLKQDTDDVDSVSKNEIDWTKAKPIHYVLSL